MTDNTQNTGSSGSVSVINLAVEAVMDLIDALSLFATISRGALPTGNGITCEIGPSGVEGVYMDKEQYIPLDLTINGKHTNLQTLSEAMNKVHETLTMMTGYPSGSNWKITDIQTLTQPQIIAREDGGHWLMASALSVRIYMMKGE